MPDSFDLSFLGEEYYALLPDYSANALWAGRPEKIPAGLYHMRITDTRSSLLRGREYLVFSLLILEGPRRGRTIEVRFNVLSPVPTVRRRCYARLRNLQEVCGLGEADLVNAAQFRGCEFRGYVWCEERRGQPVIDIACFYRSDGTWPGMEAVCANGGDAGQSGMPGAAPGEGTSVSRPGCRPESGNSVPGEENPYLREGGDWRDDDTGGADAYSAGSARFAGTCGSASPLRARKEARA